MNKYILAYDLRKPGYNYSKLYEKLKQFEYSYRISESFWIIKSIKSLDQAFIGISLTCDSNDKLFIIDQFGHYMTSGYNYLESYLLNLILKS